MKNKFILLPILAYSIIGCKPDVIGEPVLYNFYFNIKHDDRNIFNTYESYSLRNVKFSLNHSSFFPLGGSFFKSDSLFGIYEAASSWRNLDEVAFDKTIILDFGNGDYDTIVIDNTNLRYDISYNDSLVESYDLDNEEFALEFTVRNSGGILNNLDPIIIEVEKRLEVQ